MSTTTYKYGIEGQTAPELKVSKWVDGSGGPTDEIKLSDYVGKFKIIYCFQS